MYPDGTFLAEYVDEDDIELYSDYWRGVYFVVEHLVVFFSVPLSLNRIPEWDKEVTLHYFERMEIVGPEKVKFCNNAMIEGDETTCQEMDKPFPEKTPPPHEPYIKRAVEGPKKLQ